MSRNPVLPLLRVVGLLLVLALPWTAWGQGLGNAKCPVNPGEEATAEHYVDHDGRRIHFCCADCVEAFKANPREYLPALAKEEKPPEQPPASWGGHSHPPGTAWDGSGGEGGHGHAWSVLHGLFSSLTLLDGVLLTLLMALAACALWVRRRLRRQPSTKTEARPSGSIWTMDGQKALYFLMGAAMAVVIVWLVHRNRQLAAELQEWKDKDTVHFATFFDFGFPPQPAHPPLPPRLSGTYYRGNDERSEKLFNGGNYLTSTFEVSVVRANGESIEAGARLSEEPLWIQLIIQRAPHTPDFFFADSQMKRIFLSKESDPLLGSKGPVPDRVDLESLVPMQRWRARYPLGSVATSGAAELSGVVYVFEERWEDERWIGSRFHYGLQYALKLENGEVLPTSDLWMGALYRTRKVMQWKLPLSEWFSEKPIPPLPGAGSENPVLLGIEEGSDRMP